ncbi:hypothetical protein WH91_06790 [Devosia psychrophila]|uniref:Uncharacterized protein n=1 Tax=Devosia psychrophila TaxID=728005 RepID=A0ABR5E0D1_9HYPH|nr:hypothetical protein WH91_06790 [Devosia psychrophila]
MPISPRTKRSPFIPSNWHRRLPTAKARFSRQPTSRRRKPTPRRSPSARSRNRRWSRPELIPYRASNNRPRTTPALCCPRFSCGTEPRT